MRILRILRGMVLTSLTWAIAWVPLSLMLVGLSMLFGIRFPAGFLTRYLIIQAILGGINGAVFAGILAVAGRRKTFDTLSLPWIAVCGGLGAALVPFALRLALSARFDIPVAGMVLTFLATGILGAAGATLTLAIARRAPALPRGDGDARPAIDAGGE